MTDNEKLILVDADDNLIGYADKLEAHQAGGQLHRAFSVLVFNARDQLLLQRRASVKYHFADYWSNTCCGHPTAKATLIECAEQRLQEEFGFTTPLTPAFVFQYSAHDDASGLTERELDHVLVGRFHGEPRPNPAEIGEYRWVALPDLYRELAQSPEQFTPWFRILMSEHRRSVERALAALSPR